MDKAIGTAADLTISTSQPPPSWAKEIATSYSSGAASQFVLHGNVYDRFTSPNGIKGRLSSLTDVIENSLLTNFDVIISYDLGSGIRIMKGSDLFATWPHLKREPVFPRAPLSALEFLTHYFRYCANLLKLNTEQQSEAGVKNNLQVACFIKDCHLLAPSGPASTSLELGALILLLKGWSTEELLTEHSLVTFLVTENLSDLNPILVNNSRAAKVRIPLPDVLELERAINLASPYFPTALRNFTGQFDLPARYLVGAQLATVESLFRTREYQKTPLDESDLRKLKKELVERDSNGLIEIVESSKSLANLHGMERVKAWLRQDIDLWNKNDVEALPMGYLLCGPVGTGKTYVVECLAGEAAAPVVKIKNFRDRWVGSSEGNLEKIFRLLHALGRCIVFIDEADQTLGKRDGGSGDSGLSGRIYSMIAQEMSNSSNRGKIMWVLASSRPDLIEVDLKRPGRIDVKIPLLPSASLKEGFNLLIALCRRKKIDLNESHFDSLEELLPDKLTPGAAEALSMNIYRRVKTQQLDPQRATAAALRDYQPPVDPKIIDFQIGLAVKEASDFQFVPDVFRSFSKQATD